jgi:hypothetical protein
MGGCIILVATVVVFWRMKDCLFLRSAKLTQKIKRVSDE